MSTMNVFANFGHLNENNDNGIFQNKGNDLLQHPVNKKRSFNEISTKNVYPSKSKRTLKQRQPVKIKQWKNTTIDKPRLVERNITPAIITGMHPVLKEAKKEIVKLGINLRKVQEQSTFWRRKTFGLQKELLSSKSNVSHLSEQVVNLELERVMLQKKVAAAEKMSSTISNAMKSLIAENKDLLKIIAHKDEELKTLMVDDVTEGTKVPEDAKVCATLEKALEDTMADLSNRLCEIDDLKKVLAKVTIEKNLLEKEVSKKHIIAEFVNLSQDEVEIEDLTGDKKITLLQKAVENCMFRIAVLSQKNEELIKFSQNATFSSNDNERIMNIFEDSDNLSILESMCMKRYRKLFKEAADELITQGTLNDSF